MVWQSIRYEGILTHATRGDSTTGEDNSLTQFRPLKPSFRLLGEKNSRGY